MKLYWWNSVPNLGDQLNPMLFPWAEWAPPDEADWIAVGSNIERFPGFTGTVFGSGRAGPNGPPTDLRQANVLALRGLLSREHTLVTGDTVYGDPGLLMAGRLKRVDGEYVAIVPHWQDQDRMLTLFPGARFVDVMGDPWEALKLIAGAGRVVSSSLHGIVLADAFGIPRMWDWFDGVQGDGFKFRDYGSVVGKFEPGQWQEPDVSELTKELRECLSHPRVRA